MSEWVIYPLVELEDGAWSVPDEVLTGMWSRLCREDKARALLYGGKVRTVEQWISFLKEPGQHVCIAMSEGIDSVMIAWVNSIENGCAWCHQVVLGHYHRGMGEAVLRYWLGWTMPDGSPLFRTLLGMTPETYSAAVKLVRLMGFRVIGTIPHICYLAYEGRHVGGVMSYFDCQAARMEDYHGRSGRCWARVDSVGDRGCANG